MKHKSVLWAFIYKFSERIAVKGLGLIISVILARLLAPEIFGLLAIIEVFINLANTFISSGLGTALVQNSTTKEEDYSTVFFLSFGIAIVANMILFVCAPAIGAFYKNDMIVWPLRVLSVALLFGALNSVQVAKLQREMRFREMMVCNLVATVLSGAVGVAAAFGGLQLWALVIYHVASTVVTSVGLVICSKWHPKWFFSVTRAKEFWGFGWKMLVSALLCSLYNDARSLIVGKRYSTVELAYYNKGQQFPSVLSSTLDTSFQSVMLPVMSRAQKSKELLNDYLLRSIALSSLAVIPAMLGLAAISKTFFPYLLTEKWNQSIPLLYIFCISYLFIPIQTPNLSLVMAAGRSDLYMKLEIIRRIVMLAILLPSIFCFHSGMAIAVGFLVSSIVDTFVIVAGTKRITDLGLGMQLSKIWKIFLSGFIMAVVVFFMNDLALHPLLLLISQIAVGAAVYIGALALMKEKMLFEGIGMLKKFIGK